MYKISIHLFTAVSNYNNKKFYLIVLMKAIGYSYEVVRF